MVSRKILTLAVLSALVAGLILPGVVSAGPDRQSMPANEFKIARSLAERGLIPAGATEDEVEGIVQSYLQHKAKPVGVEPPDNAFLAKKWRHRQENAVRRADGGRNLFHGRKLGVTPMEVDPFVAVPWDGAVKKDKILILLVEFTDLENGPSAAPEHNYLPRPGPENNTDFWTSDFSREHYQNMLFTEGGYTTPEGLHLKSMVDYYLEQSGGSYTVDGVAYGWFKVSRPEAYYGDDDPAGGHDNLRPGTPQTLVKETVALAAAAGVPFEDYDFEDPFDLDGDGNYDEPDGIVDHLMIVHAGAGQEGGGGAQGDDAIWSHSSATFARGNRNAKVDYWGGYTITWNYTIMPEDGAIGVFAHEFAHDLGLPDEYDTIYSGEAPTGFWTLMSSGSWLGRPLGTEPSSMSPWGRMVLGGILGGRWVNPTRVDYADITREGLIYLIDKTTGVGQNNQAIRINLPKHPFYVNQPYSGSYEWFGGKADEIDATLVRAVDLAGKTSATLDFWTWYDIEELWDYGFVQVSTDGGATWTSLYSQRMTYDHDPSAMETIIANLPGYTGSSGGWVHETFDLSAYAGQQILLQFRYMTDWGVTMAGFMIDDIRITADGQVLFFDDVETLAPGWTANIWTRYQGYNMYTHYYLAEWRTHDGFDSSLAYTYNFFGLPNTVEWFSYDPGLLLWYRDTAYTDNWVGVHPGRGFLSVVDSHPQPMITPIYGLPWRTRVQIHDAAFSLVRGADITLTRYGKSHTYQAKQAQPEFNDSHPFWNPKAPDAGVLIPEYGIKFRVLGHAPDFSVGAVGIYK